MMIIYLLVSLVLVSLHALPQFLLKLIGHISFFFIQIHYPRRPDFDFHKYMIHALEYEFKRVVGIRLVSYEKKSMFA